MKKCCGYHPVKIRPDVVIDGVGYWESCDYEQIEEDAAQALEELTK